MVKDCIQKNLRVEADIYSKFKASNGWLEKFKRYYNLSYKTINKEVKKLKSKETFKDIEEDVLDFYDGIDKRRKLIQK